MTHDELAEQLALFDKDPKSAMNQVPAKQGQAPEDRQGVDSLFGQSSRVNNAFVEQRDRYRKLINTERDGQLIRLGQVEPGRAPFLNNDRAENLVDGNAAELIRTLKDAEARNLRKASLGESPWSDWYWPIYQGILGARYNDPGFPLDSEDWKQKREYVLQNSADTVVASGDQDAIDRLSPSEKYDLLIGDKEGHLTEAMWAEGERYYDQNGKVERWMGICHGWAPAAYMLKRPRGAVQILAADGKTKILFYPSDLKSLGSLLWAKAAPSMRFIGGRCNDKAPQTDENGRVRSQQCFDTNPGTFHLTLVNQIGLRKRSFIIDATYDYEVWNQPMFSYEYSYWNPQTRRPVGSLPEAKVARTAFANDRFASYRSQEAAYIVGIGTKIAYVAETMPTDDRTDRSQNDLLKSVSYTYDVELDANGRILGGEWYTNLHPDFLWTPAPEAKARSTTDYAATGEWTDETVPETWRRAAISAARNGQPLGRLVSQLIKWSYSKGI